jgi:uncharacterized protein (DUF433 family)
MNTTPTTDYRHLSPRPESAYRQLFVKGTRIRAEVLYRQFASSEPLTPEEIAANFELPVEAVKEAIAYCESQPAEIAQDRRREEFLAEASGMNDPDYKLHGKPKLLSPQELARLGRR